MMKICPECGSADIIPDLFVFADEALSGQHAPYVELVEPEPAKKPFIWSPKTVATGFRAAVCGNCGYTHFYTTHHKELWEAHKKGYKTQEPTGGILPAL
jgi:predicted nucleic-acid-binding Zn-ribbon protein